MSDDPILVQLRREQACIQAIHARPWWRVGILLRRPWRREPPWRYGWSLRNLWSWLTVAHDCADPMVACSCTGGFRFPRHAETGE